MLQEHSRTHEGADHPSILAGSNLEELAESLESVMHNVNTYLGAARPHRCLVEESWVLSRMAGLTTSVCAGFANRSYPSIAVQINTTRTLGAEFMLDVENREFLRECVSSDVDQICSAKEN